MRYVNHGEQPPRRIRIPARMEESSIPAGEPSVTSPEEQAEPVGAGEVRGSSEPCREALEAARREAEEWKDRYIRLRAEWENARKRMEQRYADEAEREKERLLRSILPIIDHLEAALRYRDSDPKQLIEGIELTLKALKDTLAAWGVQPIEALHAPFDPTLHEAVGVENVAELPSDTVVAEEQKGYTYGERLLRPARVRVNR